MAVESLFARVDAEHAESDLLVRCADGQAWHCHKLILGQHERFRCGQLALPARWLAGRVWVISTPFSEDQIWH